MTCLYCGEPLRGFGDAEIVMIYKHKYVRCQNLEACQRRIDLNEAASRGMEPAAAAGRE